MTEAAEWIGRVGDAWAEEWRRTDRTIGPLNPRLVAGIADQAGATPRILDVGCGAGATSLALADAIPGADVTGIDLSEALVAAARARAGDRADLRFEAADAAHWTAPSPFDALVSRHGVMFFDDPVGAFSNLRAAAAPGAPFVFSCFRGRGDNQWVRALAPVIASFAPEAMTAPDPPVGPFAFADPARVESILAESGWGAPTFERFDFDFTAGEGGGGEAAVADAVDFFRRIGPFAALLRTLGAAESEAALAMLRRIAADHLAGARVAFRAAAWIVTSRAS